MININYNSLHAKTYRFFYGTQQMPKSLCPYFWRMVLAFILVIPVTILSAPVYVANKFAKEGIGLTIQERLISGFFLYFGLFLGWCAIASLLYIFTPLKGNFIEVSAACGSMVWVIGLALLIGRYHSNRAEKYRLQYRSNNISYEEYKRKSRLIPAFKVINPANWLLIKAVKAWHEKICPMITWDNK